MRIKILGIVVVCLIAFSASVLLTARSVSAARSPVILTPSLAFIIDYGGMGTSTWQTKAIPFFNGTNFTENVPRLNWDDTNFRLGIGTSTPYSRLSIWGSTTGATSLFELTDSASTTLVSVLNNGTAYLKGSTGIGTTSPMAKLAVQPAATTGSTTPMFVLWNSGSTTPAIYVGSPNQNGVIGIGTTSPNSTLHVTTPDNNATTSAEIGKSGQSKGSCLVMYDAAGTVQYVSIVGGVFAISATSCK